MHDKVVLLISWILIGIVSFLAQRSHGYFPVKLFWVTYFIPLMTYIHYLGEAYFDDDNE